VRRPAPRRECRVRLRVRRGDSTHERAQSRARNTLRLRFYKNKELNVSAELAQAAEHNDNKLYDVSKILDARYNEQEMFHELLVAWRGFPVGEATCEPYLVMAVDVPDMVLKFMESHEDIDAVREIRSL
jgi:hypothetical protein